MQPQATQTPPATEPKPEMPPQPATSMPAAGAPTQPAAPAKTGYGKRPVWQWVLIYVVLAVIVYGLVYFLWIHKSGTTTGGY